MSRGASGEAAGRLVEEKVGVTAGIVTGKALDFKACGDCLGSVSGHLDMGIQFLDMVLQPFNPVFLLGETLPTFFLAAIDEFCNLVSQSFILQVTDVGEGRADGRDDGRGKRSSV